VDDERQQDMGLVLDYNAVGLMSNNVSLYNIRGSCTMYRQFYVHLFCPNSLVYIQGEVVQFIKSIMLRRSAVGDHVSLASLRPIPFLLIDTQLRRLQNRFSMQPTKGYRQPI